MIEIFGTTYYVMFPSVIIFVFFSFLITGLVAGFKRHWRWKKIAAVSFVLIIGLFMIVFGDVYRIGQQATKLCKEEGGLHVYRTVEAEGFVGGVSIKYWADYGFKYVEYPVRNKKTRFTMSNGKEKREIVDEYISEYTVNRRSINIDNHIIKNIISVRDRSNGDVLGDLVFLQIFPGWIDSRLIGVSGFSFAPWSCGDEPKGNSRDALGSNDVVKATLKPYKKLKE